MFLDRFNEGQHIDLIDDSKYKSMLDLQLEYITAKYDLNSILESDLELLNESFSDKLNSFKEYLKKLWDKFVRFIKRMCEYISKKFSKLSDKLKDCKNKNITIKKSFELNILKSEKSNMLVSKN